MERKKNPSELYINVAKYILNVKAIVGLLLIAIGVYAAITIIIIIYKIFMDFQSIPFMKHIINSGNKIVDLFSVDHDSIGISEKVFGYIVMFILLSIGSRLSVKIISVGFKIVDKLELKYLMEKIWEEWQITKKSENNTKESKLPGSGNNINFK